MKKARRDHSQSKQNRLNHNHYDIIDAGRGFAILLMFIYHFSYDLNYFGYIQQNFTTDHFWINFRTVIVALFLTIMGISLYLASYRKLNKKRFRQRILLLFAYAALVSISSGMMFPDAIIFFGILHFILLASLLGILFIRLGQLNLVLGTGLIILSYYYQHPLFDQPMLQWFGLTTHLPVTVDYVPFLPWFGVVLIGLYLGEHITRLSPNSPLLCWKSQNPVSRTLTLAGRYSLHIYMLHQPLFLGILYIISQLI